MSRALHRFFRKQEKLIKKEKDLRNLHGRPSFDFFPRAHSWMNSVAPLVLALLNIFSPCLPCTTPLLTKVSWIGGKCASPFRIDLHFSSGYCPNWTIPWSPSLCRAFSKASLCPSGSPHYLLESVGYEMPLLLVEVGQKLQFPLLVGP